MKKIAFAFIASLALAACGGGGSSGGSSNNGASQSAAGIYSGVSNDYSEALVFVLMPDNRFYGIYADNGVNEANGILIGKVKESGNIGGSDYPFNDGLDGSTFSISSVDIRAKVSVSGSLFRMSDGFMQLVNLTYDKKEAAALEDLAGTYADDMGDPTVTTITETGQVKVEWDAWGAGCLLNGTVSKSKLAGVFDTTLKSTNNCGTQSNIEIKGITVYEEGDIVSILENDALGFGVLIGGSKTI